MTPSSTPVEDRDVRLLSFNFRQFLGEASEIGEVDTADCRWVAYSAHPSVVCAAQKKDSKGFLMHEKWRMFCENARLWEESEYKVMVRMTGSDYGVKD